MFDDCLFVFGGCDGQSIRNDLFSLDLDDHEWTEVETSGVERPQAIVRLAQTNFHFCKPAGEMTLLNVLRVLDHDEQIIPVWRH